MNRRLYDFQSHVRKIDGNKNCFHDTSIHARSHGSARALRHSGTISHMRDGTLEFKKPRIQKLKKPIQESGGKNLPRAKKTGYTACIDCRTEPNSLSRGPDAAC